MADVVLKVDSFYKKFSRSTTKAIHSAFLRVFCKVFAIKLNGKVLRAGEFFALNNISFELKQGEVLGLIGVNGSGKTTLLKCICGLFSPDSGSMTTSKRITPLFASGAGFNPALNGIENVRLYLSLLGLTGEVLELQCQMAIEFSELEEEALQSPIRTYSSGMRARLGFASVIMSLPDVLIIDEALAVGDMNFRRKCYQKISQLKKQGVSFIIVSHSPNAIISHCDRAIYLKRGAIAMTGLPRQCMDLYESDMMAFVEGQREKEKKTEVTARSSQETIVITDLYFEDESGHSTSELAFLKNAILITEVKFLRPFSVDQDLKYVIVCRELRGEPQILFDKTFPISIEIKEGRYRLSINLSPLNLHPGLYTLKVFFSSGDSFNILAALESYRFRVQGERSELGLYCQNAILENIEMSESDSV